MAADIIIEKFQFKHGDKTKMPILDDGEPFVVTIGPDAGEWWVGTKTGVNKVVNDLTEFRQAVADYNQAKTDTETAVANANDAVDRMETVIAGNTNSAEVIDARGGFPLLKNHLDDINAQLAQTVNLKQTDLVELLQKKNYLSDTIYAKINGQLDFEVAVPFKGSKVASYSFYRAGGEEYLRLIRGDIATLNTSNSKTRSANYDSKTGAWVESIPPNYYTQEVGATMGFAFTGTGVYFQHVADNRGGIWEFVFDGDTANKVTISTYQASGTTTKKTLVKNNLPSGSHTVVATFKGDDPLNVPSSGAGTARGWACFNDGANAGKETFDVYDDIKYTSRDFPVYAPASNIEFAIGMKPKDTALTEYFVPDHGTKVTYVDKVEVYFDDQLITDWTAQAGAKAIKVVKIYQEILAKHPDDLVNPMARIYSLHTITAKGVEFFTKIKYLRDVSCKDGYALMLPCDNTFASKLITSMSNVYDATKRDDTSTDLTENNNGISFAFINEGGLLNRPNIVMAMTMNNPYKTLRMDKNGRRSPLFWLQHRSGTMQKLYPQSFKDAVMLTGETDEFSGTLVISELPNASLLLA